MSIKDFFVRVKLHLTTDRCTSAIINTQERVGALETYVKDLKYACDKLGFDPKKHGVRELEADEVKQ